jgi:hypothetical protein
VQGLLEVAEVPEAVGQHQEGEFVVDGLNFDALLELEGCLCVVLDFHEQLPFVEVSVFEAWIFLESLVHDFNCFLVFILGLEADGHEDVDVLIEVGVELNADLKVGEGGLVVGVVEVAGADEIGNLTVFWILPVDLLEEQQGFLCVFIFVGLFCLTIYTLAYLLHLRQLGDIGGVVGGIVCGPASFGDAFVEDAAGWEAGFHVSWLL